MGHLVGVAGGAAVGISGASMNVSPAGVPEALPISGTAGITGRTPLPVVVRGSVRPTMGQRAHGPARGRWLSFLRKSAQPVEPAMSAGMGRQAKSEVSYLRSGILEHPGAPAAGRDMGSPSEAREV